MSNQIKAVTLNDSSPLHIKLIEFFLNNKALIILLVICIASTFASPFFLTSRNLINIARQVAASAVIGIGFTVIIASGNLDLSVGFMVGTLGVIMGLLSQTAMPFGVVLLIGAAVGAGFGLFNAMWGVVFGLPLFIVTLASGEIFRGMTFLLSGAAPVINLNPAFRELGQGHIGPIPIPIIIMFVVLIVVYFLLNKTIFGRQAIAAGGNRDAARIAGINVKKITVLVYMLMGVCASIAAMIITGRAASAQPIAGSGMAMDAIAAVVIGGTPLTGGSGKVVGTLIGCLLVGVINNVLNLANVDASWQMAAKGMMILVAIFLDVISSNFFNARLRKQA